MKIYSTVLKREIEVDEKEVINFPDGMIGFPDKKRFVFLSVVSDGLTIPVEILHSIDDTSLAFFVVDPQIVSPEFSIRVSESELKDIGITFQDAMNSLCRIIVKPEKDGMSFNFLCPIVVNAKDKKAKQVIVDGPEELMEVKVSVPLFKKELMEAKVSVPLFKESQKDVER